jgi:hypothetical protein
VQQKKKETRTTFSDAAGLKKTTGPDRCLKKKKPGRKQFIGARAPALHDFIQVEILKFHTEFNGVYPILNRNPSLNECITNL